LAQCDQIVIWGCTIDLVGGQQLIDAYGHLAEHGLLVAVGLASGDPGPFPPGAFSSMGWHDRSIVTLSLLAYPDLRDDLGWLATQVAAGLLDPQISWRGSWTDAREAIEALLARRLHGKAVLELG
jgi:NADPH2:quinone reductase